MDMGASTPQPLVLLPESRALLERLQPGMMLGVYQLKERIGVGGAGVVHRAEDLRDGHEVAIKVLVTPNDKQPRELLSRFQVQAAILEGIRHDAIGQILDSGFQDDLCYLVMELVLGPEDEPVSLIDYANWFGGVIDPIELVDLYRLILSAFLNVHLHKVVHGNIKPQNVLLQSETVSEGTWEASIKITDFGLTRILGTDFVIESVRKSVRAQDMKTATLKVEVLPPDAKALIETYDYMSPEQRLGKGASRRSDVFSLGLMFLHLLTGKKVIGFEPPSRLVPDITPEWDAFILRATAQDRRQRFPTVAEMLDALEALPLMG
jgi:serine/threonine-protein kinase